MNKLKFCLLCAVIGLVMAGCSQTGTSTPSDPVPGGTTTGSTAGTTSATTTTEPTTTEQTTTTTQPGGTTQPTIGQNTTEKEPTQMTTGNPSSTTTTGKPTTTTTGKPDTESQPTAPAKKTGLLTVSFAERAGNIVIDRTKNTITIPVKADISYVGKLPTLTVSDGYTAKLTAKGGSDLNADLYYEITGGGKTETWKVVTTEVYNNVVAAYELTTASVFTDNGVLQREKPVKIWGTCEGAKVVTLEFGGQKRRAPVVDGCWEVTLSAMEANATGQKMTVNAGGTKLVYDSVYVGDVWLCSGQSNMDMAVRYLSGAQYNQYLSVAENRKIRVFRVNRDDSSTPQEEFAKAPTWSTPSKSEVKYYSAYAYAFAVRLEDEYNIPIGIIDSAYGGTNIQEWMTPEALKKAGTSYSISMYNAMIHPMVGMSIKGILWYQGESNVNDTTPYDALFREYAALYRELFNDPNLPIITTQLPQYAANEYPKWPEFRLTQWEIANTIDNVHIVCGIDLGDATNIHPLDKFVFGTRAAELAINKVYNGSELGESAYPQTVTALGGGEVKITFINVDKGLEIKNDTLQELYLVAADGTKVEAQVVSVSGNTLVVKATGVSAPKTVEYCMSSVPKGTLFDKNGLPVAPFSCTVK